MLGLNIFWWLKRTSLHRTAYFDIFCVIVCGCILAVGERKNPSPKKQSKQFGGRICARTNETLYLKQNPLSNLDKILQDHAITCANFGNNWLKGLGVTGGQILPFLTAFRHRLYNSLVLLCHCVIFIWIGQWTQSHKSKTLVITKIYYWPCPCSPVARPLGRHVQ